MDGHEGKPIEGIVFASIIGVIFYTGIAAGVQQCDCRKGQEKPPAAKKEASAARPEAGPKGARLPKDAASAAGVPGSEKGMRKDYLSYVRRTTKGVKPRARGAEPMKPRSANFNPAKMRLW